MTSKHTPGPWRALAHSDGFELLGANGDFIADVHRRGGRHEDDARLIASAPDLADALALLLAEFGPHDNSPAIGRARAALNKLES